MLEGDIETQRVSAKFGEIDVDVDNDEESVAILEKFVCNVYAKRRLCSVDDVRLQIFIDKYKQKESNQNITCVEKFNGTPFPRIVVHAPLSEKTRFFDIFVGGIVPPLTGACTSISG